MQESKNQADPSPSYKNDEKLPNVEKSHQLVQTHHLNNQPSGFHHVQQLGQAHSNVILPTPTFVKTHHLGQFHGSGEFLPMVQKESLL